MTPPPWHWAPPHPLLRIAPNPGALPWAEVKAQVIERATHERLPCDRATRRTIMRWLGEALRANGVAEADMPKRTALNRHATDLANAWDRHREKIYKRI